MTNTSRPTPINSELFSGQSDTILGSADTHVPDRQTSGQERVWTPPPTGLLALEDIKRRITSPDQKNPLKAAELRFFELSQSSNRTVAENLDFRMACVLAIQVRKKGPWEPSAADITRISEAKASTNRTQDEESLCSFSDFSAQTTDERRLFSALLAKVRSSDRDKRAQHRYAMAQQKPSERRLLVHKKIQRGGLCYVANAQHLDPATFVGMLSWALKYIGKHGPTWKVDGETILSERRAINNDKSW